jgi:hypothetical protein
MKILKYPHPGTRVCRHVHDPDLLARCQLPAATIFRDLVSQSEFTGRKEQNSPACSPPCRSISCAASFARAVRQHVSDLAGFA